MIPIPLRSACVLLLAILLPGLARTPAHGQSLTHGSLHGVVRDPSGLPLAEASLSLRDRATGSLRTATTAREGRFSFVLLLPGTYDLLTERFGYQPQHLEEIALIPGERLELPLELSPAGESSADVEVVRFDPGANLLRGVDGRREFAGLELRGLPAGRREIHWLSALSSESGPRLEIQGLPSHLSGLYVDGAPVAASRHPQARQGALDAAHFALSAFERAELVTGGMDVEWSGLSGGALSGHTRRGTSDFRIQAFGDWSGVVEESTRPAGGGAAPFSGLQGGVLISGPILRDTASFVAGLEVWRVEDAITAAGGADSLRAKLAAIAADSYGVTLPDAARTTVLRTDALSGFARVDWQMGSAHQLSARSSFALSPGARESVGAPGRWEGGRFQGSQFSAGAEVISRLSPRLSQETRVGADFANRDYERDAWQETAEVEGFAPAPTHILADGWTYGAGTGLLGNFQQATIRGSETLYLTSGAHALKLGLGGAVHSYDYRYDAGRSGEFVFSGVGGFARRQGVFTQAVAASPEAEFTVPQFNAFVQDTWRAAPGLEILAGVRFDVERLPRHQVSTNEAWLERTGLDNASFRATSARVSPRVGFTWDLLQRRWTVFGNAGLFNGSTDPALVGDLLSHGSVEVRRGIGSLAGWPALPDSSFAPLLGPRLHLLAPGFAPPRSARMGFGLGHRLGRSTAVHLSTAYRRTDFLPRRHDLNLLPVAVGRDQYGRPLFGSLRQQGGLLVAENLSNRRFPDFEQVLAVDVDGWSEYRGVTLAAEHRAGEGLRFAASYTLSGTRDNWLAGGAAGGEPTPFPEQGENDGWTEGTSDFDVPHRAVVGAEAAFPGLPALRLAALYRFRSGYPFTPGFREGVDANADGFAGNDPAFVDEALPGMAEVLEAWPCLADFAGRFVARNACRGSDVHALDLRLSLRLRRGERYSVALVLDGLNLAGAEEAFPDRALYLLDDSRATVTQPSTGEAEVPLLVNSSFGRPLARLGAGRVLRFGFRLDH